MYGSKKQHWILEIVKAVDLTPAGGISGKYTAKGTMIIATDCGESVSISTTDVLDLSNAQLLRVEMPSAARDIEWERIARIDFEAPPPAAPPLLKPALASSVHRLLPFPLSKKAG
jgi:hypothetical protein